MLAVGNAQELVAEHLGTSPRARHSAFVGFAMQRLAEQRSADAELWTVVGLVHDLDHEATAHDRSQHGRLTAEWLANRLPTEALDAIAAHDHRTGVVSDTVLADALKLADALAVICEALGPDAPSLLAESDAAVLAQRFADRPYLPELLMRTTTRLDVPLAFLAAIARDAPLHPTLPVKRH